MGGDADMPKFLNGRQAVVGRQRIPRRRFSLHFARVACCQAAVRPLSTHLHAECCAAADVLQVWARDYSAEDPERCDCDALQEALGMIQGARRMVCSPFECALPAIKHACLGSPCTQPPLNVDCKPACVASQLRLRCHDGFRLLRA
jgi:hypothetical protein